MAQRKRRPPTSPPLLTIREAAEVLGVTTATVNRWAAQDDDPLPSKRLGLRRVIFPEDLRRWAEARDFIFIADPAEVARPWPRRERA